MLAEHDDPDLGARLTKLRRRLDALVRQPGRHPDVGDDDIRAVRCDRLEQRVEIAARRDDLEVVLRLEQMPEPLADEVLVFGQHDPDRHGARIRG